MTSHRGHHASTAGTSTAEPQREQWHDQAACRDKPTDFFYPEGRGVQLRRAREEAKQFCLDLCPVVQQCRDAGRDERHGIWGGTDERDRGYDPRGRTREVAA